MLFKFRSRTTAPVIMLHRSAERLLGILGKSTRAYGVVTHEELPHAIEMLRSAIEEDDMARARRHDAHAGNGDLGWHDDEHVSLRQRAGPLIEMMERSHASGGDITWGLGGRAVIEKTRHEFMR